MKPARSIVLLCCAPAGMSFGVWRGSLLAGITLYAVLRAAYAIKLSK
jgi:hypothetical protein